MPLNHSLAQGRKAEEPEAPKGRASHRTAPLPRPGRRWWRRRNAETQAQEPEPLWVREVRPLRKPAEGWAFADPARFPVAEPAYGDRRAFERRLNASTIVNASAEAVSKMV